MVPPGVKKIIARHVAQPKRLFLGLRVATVALLFLGGLFLALGAHPLAVRIQRASYDWLYKLSFFARPDISRDSVVIVYIDEASQNNFHQPRNAPWDRALYAKLLDRLHDEGAAAVVLDVIFSGPS